MYQSMEVRQRIGYLPESVPLYPEMRVGEYLAYRARLKGVDRAIRGSVGEARSAQLVSAAAAASVRCAVANAAL